MRSTFHMNHVHEQSTFLEGAPGISNIVTECPGINFVNLPKDGGCHTCHRHRPTFREDAQGCDGALKQVSVSPAGGNCLESTCFCQILSLSVCVCVCACVCAYVCV